MAFDTVFTIIVVFSVIVVAIGVMNGYGLNPIKTYDTYYFGNTTVECSVMREEYCGVQLSDCTDGKTYRCLTNVAYDSK